MLSVPLAASSATPEMKIRIRSTSGSPQGAKLHYIDGNPARATYTWTPAKSQIGVYHVTFTAASDLPVGSATRTLVIRVGPPNRPPPGPVAPAGVYPKRYTLSDALDGDLPLGLRAAPDDGADRARRARRARSPRSPSGRRSCTATRSSC